MMGIIWQQSNMLIKIPEGMSQKKEELEEMKHHLENQTGVCGLGQRCLPAKGKALGLCLDPSGHVPWKHLCCLRANCVWVFHS